MDEKKQQQQLPVAQQEPLLYQQRRPKSARKWLAPLLIGGALTLFAWRRMDQWRPYFSNRGASTFDMSYPADTAAMSGPIELSNYLQELENVFGRKHERSGCHHRDHGLHGQHEQHKHAHHKDGHRKHGHHKDGHHKHGHQNDDENDDNGDIPDNEFEETMVACPDGKFDGHCGKVGVAFPPDHLKHERVPRRHEPFCKPEELESTTKEFTFSPEEFKRAAVFVDGRFSRGGRVRVHQSDEAGDEVKVKVTLYAGQEHLVRSVSLSGFDHNGQYSVEVKRARHGFHHPPPPPHEEPNKDNCLVYAVDIIFPADLESYEDLDLHIRSAHHVGGEVHNLVFDKFRAGVGRGAIYFKSLHAKQITLGVLRGFIGGRYYPEEKFHAGAIRGATKPHVHPQGDETDITVASIAGMAGLELPANEYEGDFVVSSWSGSPTVEAPNPDDLHITKFTHIVKKGFYKESSTGSNVVVHNKHGEAKLIFA